MVDEDLGGSEADSNHVGVRGEEAAHGDIQDSPLPGQRHPLKVRGEWGRGKRKMEGSWRKNWKRHETGQWEGRKRVGGVEGKILGRVDDGPMGERA